MVSLLFDFLKFLYSDSQHSNKALNCREEAKNEAERTFGFGYALPFRSARKAVVGHPRDS